MARTVICRVTKEKGSSDTFYKAPNGKYYKTKEIYDEWNYQNEYRSMSIDLLQKILCPKQGMKLPTITYKYITEYDKMYDALYNTIIGVRDNIEWALNNKRFSGETNKVMYIFAIIQNNFNEYLKKLAREKREQTKEYEFGEEDFVSNSVGTDVTNLLGEL